MTYRPFDPDLAAVAQLVTTSYGRSFLELADAPAGRSLLALGTLATQNGTVSGTNTGDQDLSSYATTASVALKAPLASPTFTGTVAGVTKGMVGLGSADNTADSAKPVSTAQQTALDLKANLASPTFTGTVGGVTKAMVSLGSVDNTADTAKPVSTAQQTALDLKANLASPTFTGTVAGITASMVGLGSVTNVAQTSVTGLTGTQSVAAFKTGLSLVKADVGLGSVDNTADTAKPVSTAQQTALDLKAPLASPTFTGTVVLPAATVTLAMQANMATASVVYRKTAGSGVPEVQTLATLKTDLGLAGTNSGDQTTIVGITGTLAQFNTAVSDADLAPIANPQFTGVAYFAQGAPTAKNTTTTLTIAEILTLIITTTSATAVSLTLPTGTLTDAGILGGALAVNQAFEWYLINLGSSTGAVTLVAGTAHTIVGNAVTAIGTTSRWFTRKTATNTFVTYRIA